MPKSGTFCYEEEEEDGRSSNSENDSGDVSGHQSSRSEKRDNAGPENVTVENAQKNCLNKYDVIVPNPSVVDDE